MCGDVEMHDPPAVVSQHQEHVQHVKANGRHREEVDRNRGLHVVFQEGPPSLRSGFRRWTMYLLTLVSPMSMPSLRSSPWMRGAPRIEFSRLIFRISLRISFDTGGRPGWPRRTFQIQNSRNPLRCQAMTVPGLTMQRAERYSAQTPQNQTHRNRSNRLSFGLSTERCSTPSWWRRAMISSCSAARVRKTESVEASNADNTAVGWN